jgi:ABC-type antimicrobial peptide transport system permease subunit
MIGQSWSSALESLAAHKLRSALTLLGIVVGVAAVLAINVYGQLTQQAVARQFGPLGATLVSVTPQPPPIQPTVGGGPVIKTGGPGQFPSIPPPLDERDLQALKTVPHVTAAALNDAVPPLQAIANGQNIQARVIGATSEMQTVLAYPISAGSFFTSQDEAARANVVVLGAAVARALYPGMDPVGQPIQLNNVPFTIKGVFASQGGGGDFDLDQLSIVPYSVLDRLRGNAGMFALRAPNPVAGRGAVLQVDDVRNVPQVIASATQLLQQLHPPRPNEQPYVASDFTQALQAAGAATSTLRLALTGVATVMLILGAFGLFSMLTVSVTERTREIGVRMAVGARARDVLLQVLIEAAVLGFLGGVLGTLLGFAASGFVPRLVSGPLAGGFAFPSVDLVAGVLIGSAVLGIVFGLLPARRAANLDPATALRRT